MSKQQGPLIINDWEVPKITSYKVSYEKLWSPDTGRDLTGDMKGTLLGIYPKIEVDIGQYTQEQMSKLLSMLNEETVKVVFYDFESATYRTSEASYVNTLAPELIDMRRKRYKATSFHLIPYNKRSIKR